METAQDSANTPTDTSNSTSDDASTRSTHATARKRPKWRWAVLFLALAIASYGWSIKSPSGNVAWGHDLEAAMETAKNANKNILIQFTGAGCIYCYKMEKEVLTRGDVEKSINTYIPVRIDINRQEALANRYGVYAIPAFFLLDANGTVLSSADGYLPPESFKRFLTSAPPPS